MDSILVTRDEGVVTMTLNRPDRLNAIASDMWGEMESIFTEVARRPEDRVLVVTGAGNAFSSGADLMGERGPRQPGVTNMHFIGNAALTLHRLPKPTLARVNGVAAGAGCNLALGCDLVIASESARFSEIFPRRSLSLDFGGSWLLPRLVGLQRAKELAFFGDILSAAEAFDIGLVNRVVPDTELDKIVDEWAHRLASSPTVALAQSKAMLNQSYQISMTQALDIEAANTAVNGATEDIQEGRKAFLEKRPPAFRGF